MEEKKFLPDFTVQEACRESGKEVGKGESRDIRGLVKSPLARFRSWFYTSQ
jgi:hypothetical protein